MKRLHLLFLIMSIFSAIFDSDAQVPKPDFAFPQTAAKNAKADLDKAINANDPVKAINALMRITVADKLVDPSTLPASIALVEKTAAKFAGSDLDGIFCALQANLYSMFLDGNYKAYQRDLPMEPLPADLTEWSADQLRHRIDSLLTASFTGTNAKTLAKLPTADYDWIISCDKKIVPYYPTLLDFAYSNALSITNANLDAKSILDIAVKAQTPGTAPYINWRMQQIRYNPNQNEAIDLLLQLVADNIDKEYCGIALIFPPYQLTGRPAKVTPNMLDKILGQKARYLELCETYLNSYASNWVANELRNNIVEISSAYVSLNYPTICHPGKSVPVEVKNFNANAFTINLYSIQPNWFNRWGNVSLPKDFFSKNKPVASIPVSCPHAIPFVCDTIVDVTIPDDGYYVIVPQFDNKRDIDRNPSVIFSTPVLVMAYNGTTTPMVVVVNSLTGKPVPNAKVSVSNEKSQAIKSTITDNDGIARFSRLNSEYENITVSIDNKNYKFGNVNLRSSNSNENDDVTYKAKVFTDRALYHPGETINFMAICYKSSTNENGRISYTTLSDTEISAVIYNANGQPIDTIKGVTDEFGRFDNHCTLPTSGLTGQYSISIFPSNKLLDAQANRSYSFRRYGLLGEASFTVSDYKLPDSEIVDLVVNRDVPEAGAVTVSGMVRTYSGMPVAGAAIQANLSGISIWRMFFANGGHTIHNSETVTDADGKFQIVFPKSLFATDNTDSDTTQPSELSSDSEFVDDYDYDQIPETESPETYNFFSVTIDAVTPAGTTCSARTFFSTGKQYIIDLNIADTTVDGTLPLRPEVAVYDGAGKPNEIALQWSLKTQGSDSRIVADGPFVGDIDLSAVTPGYYTLTISATDQSLADSVSSDITIYNSSTDIVPGQELIWVRQSSVNIADDGSVDILYGIPDDSRYVYIAVCDGDSILRITLSEVKRGYHHLTLKANPKSAKQAVYFATVANYDKNVQQVTLKPVPETDLRIVAESMRDHLNPTATETWQFSIVDADGKPVKAALALDMYNKAMDALTPHNMSLYMPRYIYYSSQLYIDSKFFYVGSSQISQSYQPLKFEAPDMDPNWLYLDQIVGRYYSRGITMRKMMSVSDYDGEMMMYDAAPMVAMNSMATMEEAELCADDDIAGEAKTAEQTTANDDPTLYRDAEVPLAIWAPTLSTDASGNVVYTFAVPNANTTWRLLATSWTRDMTVGNMVRDFVANKPVMVQPNQPRFMRSGDTAVMRAMVLNNRDVVSDITATLEIFNPISGAVIKSQSASASVPAMGNATFDITYSADEDMPAIGYRVRATVTTPDGTFSDGEQVIIPILSNMAKLVETTPFYLNPSQRDYTQQLPADPGARLTLTFCENPAWTIVTALPGLRTNIEDYANCAAAAIFSAAIARGITNANPEIERAINIWQSNPTDSALVSMLQKNDDLKIALLNATPWIAAAQSDTERMANLAMLFDKNEVDNAIDGAITILQKLVRNDGGWAWGTWCKESSMWVTANVLGMMAELRQYGWLPTDNRLQKLINNAIAYYDKQLKPDQTDILYCLFRPYFNNIKIVGNGQRVINNTLSDIRKNWRKYTDPAYKAMAAEALWLNGDKSCAREIMRSVSEFGVYTPDRGLTFPSVNALYNYAILLEAYAVMMPDSREVDGLRQQLIVRKQATDWGDAVVTTEVVASILSSGSKWTVDATGAHVSVGDTVIKPSNPIESSTGNLRADLSAYAGQTLQIETSGTGPAYGAVYAQLSRKMSDVKSVGCDDLTIEKQLHLRRGTDWVLVTPDTKLTVGDRIRVQLTIHSKRNMQYVAIRDERPAAFEPVVQLPGWEWSEGVGFYRENRDDYTALNVVYMAPGTYLLTYEMNVNTGGTYSSGVATIQSQYAPELTAHSSGSILKID